MKKYICTYKYKGYPYEYKDSFYAFEHSDMEYEYCMIRKAEFLKTIDIISIIKDGKEE